MVTLSLALPLCNRRPQGQGMAWVTAAAPGHLRWSQPLFRCPQSALANDVRYAAKELRSYTLESCPSTHARGHAPPEVSSKHARNLPIPQCVVRFPLGHVWEGSGS
eukprot:6104625-Amphidinium_carterae.1